MDGRRPRWSKKGLRRALESPASMSGRGDDPQAARPAAFDGYPRRFFGIGSRYLRYNFSMLIQRAYKFRFYPTAVQRHQRAVEFGNARFVWNRCLDVRSTAWEAAKTRHTYVSLHRLVTDWKRDEFPWFAGRMSSPWGI